MPEQPLSRKDNSQRTTMGVNMDGSAWVWHGDTRYRVTRRDEWPARDYAVEVLEGPDVLDHDFVRSCANDAFIAADGAV